MPATVIDGGKARGFKCFVCKGFRQKLSRTVRRAALFGLAALVAGFAWSAGAQARARKADDTGAKLTASVMNDPEALGGFQLLYELKFDEARQRFMKWEQERPAEPSGPGHGGGCRPFRGVLSQGRADVGLFPRRQAAAWRNQGRAGRRSRTAIRLGGGARAEDGPRTFARISPWIPMRFLLSR